MIAYEDYEDYSPWIGYKKFFGHKVFTLGNHIYSEAFIDCL